MKKQIIFNGIFLLAGLFFISNSMMANQPSTNKNKAVSTTTIQEEIVIPNFYLNAPEPACKLIYTFKGGCRICWDSYGFYVKWPNHGSVAYGSNYTIYDVMRAEGLTSYDWVDTTPFYNDCECR